MSIGLGTWALGGKAYGRVERDVAVRTIQEAVNMGVSVFDTANIYGDGYVEEMLGATLQQNQSNIVITKVGYVKEFSYVQDFSKKVILASINSSMKRLQKDSLDMVLLHSPETTDLENKTVRATMEKFIDRGVVKRVGVSLRHIDQMPHAISWDSCSVIEVVFNLLDQRILDNGYLDMCVEKGIDVIGRVPLCFGILTGKYSEDHSFTDQRSRWPPSQINRWIVGAKLFSYLKTKDRTLSQAALAFCASQRGITWVIPGAKSPKQLRENISTTCLSKNEISEIRSIWEKHKKEILPI